MSLNCVNLSNDSLSIFFLTGEYTWFFDSSIWLFFLGFFFQMRRDAAWQINKLYIIKSELIEICM